MKVHGNTKHGYSRRGQQTPTYLTWTAMWRRCKYPSQENYHLYGGRGIKVWDAWESFERFLADVGEKPDGYSLDRIDPNGNYEPGNCRWIPLKRQARNRRSNAKLTYDGKTMCIAEWAELLGIKQHTLRARLAEYGWTLERALSEPIGQHKPYKARTCR